MIMVENTKVIQETFGDGTLKCVIPNFDSIVTDNPATINIRWCYDNDAELFTLWSVVNQLRDAVNCEFELTMPYIPHARQDRNVSGRVFTLKYFAKIINLLNFKKVYVLDPHSDVSGAVIDRIQQLPALIDTYKHLKDDFVIMYPDAGAAKKYSANNNAIIGNKHRNTDGRVVSYELLNFIPGTKKVLIVDDICSYGGTFVAAAKELKSRGVEQICLCVSHCEENIFKGEVFDYIDKVYTSDSILNLYDPNHIIPNATEDQKNKIVIVKMFR